MPSPSDVVLVDFPGALGVKRRPAVVVSTAAYHAARPDVILALLTGQASKATSPTDYVLKDWSQAGLHQPTALRVFLATLPAATTTVIGRLSSRDLHSFQSRLRLAIAVS
ncbi:MAG: type II toxin-antitoxin system PemK/MazF family toxin [Planctomycetes bacterium]|nr:type II toxin-antitoxin system PemK/MazF family toxin [Planctomycetota bacterium]